MSISWETLTSGLLMVASVVLLWKGADWFVDAATRIARRLGVSELVIGLTLVGLGTSAPEFAVSIDAALTGRPDISVGNVVGSNIFNLGFILGGCAAIRPIVTSRTLVLRDGLFLLAVTVLLTCYICDLSLSRTEGVSFILLLVAYLGFLLHKRQRRDEESHGERAFSRRDIPLLVLGLALILGGAELLVSSASTLARSFGMSEWAIGVTIVAAGTSAPELVTSLNAAAKGRYGISAGNLIGSDLFNLLGVLGVASTIQPMQVDPTSLSSMVLLVTMVGVVVVFMRTGWVLSRIEGTVLVVANLVRWWADIFRSGV